MAIRLLILLLLTWPAMAQSLDDPQMEARAHALGTEVRCLVCQAQSVEDSNAALARDLRRFIRDEMVAGKSDDDIRAELRAKYGDKILLQPPVTGETALLWVMPALLLVVALFMARKLVRRR